MATNPQRSTASNAALKYLLFGSLAIVLPMVLWVDERFWFDSADPHALRVAQFRTLLAFHGLTGVTVLITGTLQMSRRIRTQRPAFHRALGTVYLLAVLLSAPIALYIGVSKLEPVAIHVQQIFQAGLWGGSAVIAWVCARLRQMAMHRDWMIRSYAFTLVFVTSRIPDIFFSHYSDQFISDELWALTLIAALTPELINTGTAIARAASRRR